MNSILFIENDTYWFQQIASNFMLRPEYRVEHSTNLLEAINRINTGANQYQAVVLNTGTMMQNADPGQIIASIKEKAPFTKVICVLENNEPYQFVNMTQAGADGVLIKPYSVDALLAELEKGGQNPPPFQGGGQGTPSPNQGFPPNFQGGDQPFNPAGFTPNAHQGQAGASDNINIRNLGDMGVPGGEMHEFRPKEPQQPENNPYNPYQQPETTGASGTIPPYGGYTQGMPQGFPGFGGATPGGQPMAGSPYDNARQKGGIVRIPQNTTVAVHCPKGGVGKSSIAKELAITYALSGVNGQRLRVCLVDMDIDYGDIAVMLELKQNKSIADWARNIRSRMGNMNESDILFSIEEIEKFYLLEHKSGLKVLAAPTNYRDSALINEQIVRIVLNNLKRNFDVVVVDTGNNTKDFTVVSMEMADHIIMVCNIDVSTINEILTLRKTLEQIQFPMNKIGLLMNEIKKGDEGHIDQISNFLGLPLIGVIPRIQAVEIANNNGEALSMGKDNPFTIGIKKVANTILPVVKRGGSSRPQSPGRGPSKGKKSLFGSLFKKKQ